jgi:hypothetical protein
MAGRGEFQFQTYRSSEPWAEAEKKAIYPILYPCSLAGYIVKMKNVCYGLHSVFLGVYMGIVAARIRFNQSMALPTRSLIAFYEELQL